MCNKELSSMEKIEFKSWVINIVSQGLGAAFGIAIVGFVAYTALGVYQIKDNNVKLEQKISIMENRVSELETKEAVHQSDFKNQLDKRSKELREEIIKSNQVALDLVLDQVKNDPPEPNEKLTSDVPELPKVQSVPNVQKDALKHRFREAQQHIQQQAF